MRDALLVLLAATLPATAYCIECETPPRTALRDYDGEFELAAARVLGIKGPGATLAFKSQAKNLLDKIPNADKTLVELTYLFTLCTALRDDRAMPEHEKAKQFSEYARALQGKPKAASGKASGTTGQISTNSARSPVVTEAVRPVTIIQGNTGPVINNNDVKGDLTVTVPK